MLLRRSRRGHVAVYDEDPLSKSSSSFLRDPGVCGTDSLLNSRTVLLLGCNVCYSACFLLSSSEKYAGKLVSIRIYSYRFVSLNF